MKIVSSVEKYKNSLFSVTEDHAVDPSGFEIKRGIVRHRGSAVMMAVDDRKRILLVHQFRLPARQAPTRSWYRSATSSSRQSSS